MPEQLTPFGNALAGALGGVFSNAVVYPLDTAKTRIQATASSSKDKDAKGKGKDVSRQPSIMPMLLRILKEEGVSGYYKGFGANMANAFFQQYAYFFFYSFVRSSYIRRLAKKRPLSTSIPSLSTAAELILGALAAALAQMFTLPVSVIATRQQIATSRSNKLGGAENTQSFLAVGRKIVRDDGITGLWSGIKPSLVLTVNPAITYGVFERVKTIALVGELADAKLSPLKSFALGALSKTLATVVTYPYIMAKVRVQAGSPQDDSDSTTGEPFRIEELHDPERGTYADVIKASTPTESEVVGRSVKTKSKPPGSVAILTKVLKEEGFLGWYRGMGAQITKAVLSQALLFMLKDQFERYALLIIIFSRRLSLKLPAK